ncbi:MAG: DUF4834 family protein [Bacteroidales bacterium]|jgi:hypothetical protein|nr:DUF4834 family protein [Bacteroidales bacterium]
MMEFILSAILIFILLGYAFRLFLRYGLPWLMGRYVKKQQEKFYQGFDQSGRNAQQKKEGEVKIKQPRKKSKKDDDDFGEYVDFEDIDNK